MTGRRFTYQAMSRDGARVHGMIEAVSRESAIDQLGRQDLFVVSVKSTRRAERVKFLAQADLALGLRMLATLLESGLSMGRALSALEEVAPGRWRTELPSIRDAVRQGQSLSTAMSNSQLRIPPIVIGIIQAGEAGSGVSRAVRKACEMIEANAALQSAIRGALAYPIVLACAGTASIALLTGVVLPRFGSILADLGQGLPTSTRLVLSFATMAKAGAVPAIIGIAIAGVVLRAITSTEQGRAKLHGALLLLPAVGPVRRSSATARACAAFAALLESGVPVASAIRYTAAATGDAAIAGRLHAARESIIAGGSISRAFADHACMSPTAIRLIRTGEETGALAAMLEKAAVLESERTAQLVRTAVRLLEPMLIVSFSIIVAVVAAALLQAVYSIRPM